MAVEERAVVSHFRCEEIFFFGKKIFFAKFFTKKFLSSFVFELTEAFRKNLSPTVKQRKQHNRLPNRGIIIRMASETTRSDCNSVVTIFFSLCFLKIAQLWRKEIFIISFLVIFRTLHQFSVIEHRHGRVSCFQPSWPWWWRFHQWWCRSFGHVRGVVSPAKARRFSPSVILNNVRLYVKTASSC